ncbi:glycoside hydrolase family 25 protein [Actinomadura decatromicini]|uniref:glycoside hydrolase family 25 protein n=1 Tax=Actinomadura decatromicini TaxID=2604572 RepID=UPI001652C8DA|nr:glycoside hydrolase family 25 protein [Actinomadura decatromicini]
MAGPIYGVDVASYQGNPNWASVFHAGIRFAFSKVTQSTNYTNPTWAHNRAGMLALGDGFLPGAYHFLHGGNGAAQARFFLSKAGDVSRFAVALDVEASGADAATAREWVKEFKARTGGHPVIGYYPRWYWEQTGRPDLSFFDTIWQSHYVTGSGSPAALYGKAPSTWWSTFGGEPISILQFSSSGTVSGISGQCDVNAYRGTLDQLRALALGEEDMALTKTDAEVVWQTDGILDNPTGDKTNPKVRAAWLLTDTNQQIRNVALMVAALGKQVPDVDEDAIVRGVLAGLAPAAIAAAVVTALPADLARQVVDEIQGRLAE